ncbi:MAG TPA: helix-turn-helix transcriptional regulator [Anaerolineales bacterium]|nr:helix-turn-helix transcriptional regulator [Anaerolineales bacterium]
MADPRKKKSSRKGPQQTNRYFHVLVSPLHLVNRKDPAAQENQSPKPSPGNALSGGRRSTDKDAFELYDCWLALSSRERQVTYFTCQGYKNEQIAFHMGVSAGTVKSYLQHVFFKIGVRSKTELRLKFYNFDFERNPPY